MQSLPSSYRTVRVHVEDGTAIDPPHLSVYLQCPRCKARADGLKCSECAFRMNVHNGIVHALPPERAAYYARFISEYEQIRAAEGRGSQSEDFYLALPYKDLSGRNSEQWKIRSKSYDYLVTRVLKPCHDRTSILDLGAGNCWMSYRFSVTHRSRLTCLPTSTTGWVPQCTLIRAHQFPFFAFKRRQHTCPLRMNSLAR
jgi:hypothetical protein